MMPQVAEPAQTFRSTAPSSSWLCDDGARLKVQFYELASVAFILLERKADEPEEASSTFVLPQTMSGSGVRYSTDWSWFQMKGNAANFASKSSSLTPFVPAIACTKDAASAVEKQAQQAEHVILRFRKSQTHYE
ncbi:MAG: MliC family protein [Pseudomonadota bacterium]